jgi:uncharacterized repeat protein (TIGR01451 family)
MKNNFLLFLVLTLILPAISMAQITTNINSGSPTYPFPQFLDYGPDRQSLASNLPEGVSHAEMEKWIREAYQIMMNGFGYTGEEVAGVKLIKIDHFMGEWSEGYGYALQAAAYLGDKDAFDGLWIYTHDHFQNDVLRYSDCELNPKVFSGRRLFGSYGAGNGNATDSDFDITFALILAWKQWGDNSGLINSCGTMISYKEEALQLLNEMAEIRYSDMPEPYSRYTIGNIGFDGYIKSGNDYGELSDWAISQNEQPEYSWNTSQYFDYYAPGFCNTFAKILEENNGDSKIIDQYKRAEASSDWLTGQLIEQGYYPLAGKVEMKTDGVPVFSNYIPSSEDFRTPWRSIINYVWNGDGNLSWNPLTHTYTNEQNGHQYNAAIKLTELLNNDQDCLKSYSLSFKGISTLYSDYNIDGTTDYRQKTNYLLGSSSPAALASQDFDLMAKMFRQLVLTWDGTEGYLNSKPSSYFSGWFRLLGMLTLSGNYYNPANLPTQPNLKVYLDVNKTAAHKGDTLLYTISAQNFSPITANNIQIKAILPSQVDFISSEKGSSSGGTLTYNLSSLAGANQSGNTISFKFKVRVKSNTSEKILVDLQLQHSGKTITANSYPNIISTTFKNNQVDIIPEFLTIEKTNSETELNIGDSLAITLLYTNPEKSVLTGGRANVHLAYTQSSEDHMSPYIIINKELYHDAFEPYINYSNYRITYFAAAENNYELVESVNHVNNKKINEKFSTELYSKKHKALRFQFDSVITSPTSHINLNSNSGIFIHFGTLTELKVGLMIQRKVTEPDYSEATSSAQFDSIMTAQANKASWKNDYSWDLNNYLQTESSPKALYPISPIYNSNPNGIISYEYIPEVCETAPKLSGNILAEEWDGTIWRKIAGSAPLEGYKVQDIVVTDSLSPHLTFQNTIEGAEPELINGKLIWNLTELAPGDTGKIVYWVRVNNQIESTNCIDYLSLETNATIKGSIASFNAPETDAKINCPIVTKNHFAKDENIKAYPNPFENSITINKPADSRLEVFNISGQIVAMDISGSTISVFGQDFPSGIYLVKIIDNQNSKNIKVVKK